MVIEIKGEALELCREKCLFRPSNRSLIISDLHLGKINHFRKAGIGLPMEASFSDFQKLSKVTDQYQPDTIVFLGDLFHSAYNQSVSLFQQWSTQYRGVEKILVRGNHDIMDETQYVDIDLKLVDYLADDNFIFSHDKLEYDTDHYNIYGHIHPGVVLSGKARQSMRFPCFYFGEKEGILPAFGKFTGLHMLKPKASDGVYVIANDRIIRV